MKKIFNSIVILFLLTILTGFIYPLTISILAKVLFPKQAGGNIIYDTNKKPVGSTLIGQAFTNDRYFWPRPSSIDYNPLPSGGSNLNPVSLQLRDSVIERREGFRRKNQLPAGEDVPSEILFTSASGLDPDISPKAAMDQVKRICYARNFTTVEMDNLKKLIENNTVKSQFGFLGEKRINVLMLNLALDSLEKNR